jgi:sulfide:quinone oxidoreductase
MASRTLILGAGFGGIAAATNLRRLLEDDHEVVLVDRAPRFSMGLRKLWELVGIDTIEDGSRARATLAAHGVDFRQAEVEAIDPRARSARVAGETVEADFLVVALGAEARPDLVPGLGEHAHDVWEPACVPAARAALESLEGGRVAVVIAGAPYPCPPAPFECALLVDEWLRGQGLRDRTDVVVCTFQPILLPNAGREGSDWLAARLDERGIEHHAGRQVARFEPGRAVFVDGELEADVLIGVPPHKPPAVAAEAGLVAESGWIGVDPRTLATGHERVYAVGDVTLIELANGLPLPKAGVIAEAEGKRVAAAITATLSGQRQPDSFDGRGMCFVEFGAGEAALVEGRFFAEPEPQVILRGPAPEHARAKRSFESERLETWFGRGQSLDASG